MSLDFLPTQTFTHSSSIFCLPLTHQLSHSFNHPYSIQLYSHQTIQVHTQPFIYPLISQSMDSYSHTSIFLSAHSHILFTTHLSTIHPPTISPPIYLFIYLPIHPPTHLRTYPITHLLTHPPIHPPTHASIYLLIHPPQHDHPAQISIHPPPTHSLGRPHSSTT